MLDNSVPQSMHTYMCMYIIYNLIRLSHAYTINLIYLIIIPCIVKARVSPTIKVLSNCLIYFSTILFVLNIL